MGDLLEFFEDIFSQVMLTYGSNDITLGYLISGGLLIIMTVNIFKKIKR